MLIKCIPCLNGFHAQICKTFGVYFMQTAKKKKTREFMVVLCRVICTVRCSLLIYLVKMKKWWSSSFRLMYLLLSLNIEHPKQIAKHIFMAKVSQNVYRSLLKTNGHTVGNWCETSHCSSLLLFYIYGVEHHNLLVFSVFFFCSRFRFSTDIVRCSLMCI